MDSTEYLVGGGHMSPHLYYFKNVQYKNVILCSYVGYSELVLQQWKPFDYYLFMYLYFYLKNNCLKLLL